MSSKINAAISKIADVENFFPLNLLLPGKDNSECVEQESITTDRGPVGLGYYIRISKKEKKERKLSQMQLAASVRLHDKKTILSDDDVSKIRKLIKQLGHYFHLNFRRHRDFFPLVLIVMVMFFCFTHA